ncbi:S8 family peptidase [Streptomyces sp. NPDC058335]|uniref:S8 family peptidase n=1 Tax=Streptomyces sp. NPDC058335 TaxID=3346451 RepID=UPI003666BCD2
MPRQGMNDANRRPQYDEARGHPELICVVAEDMGVEITPSGASSARGADVTGLNELAAAPDLVLKPLFDTDLARLGRRAQQTPRAGESADQAEENLGRMVRFYQVDAPEERLEELAQRLRELDVIETAYVKPAAELARTGTEARTWTRPYFRAHERKESPINDMAPIGPDAPSMTPDYAVRQIYLDPGPAGINARHAWKQPGGTGKGVRVIDCEWGWRFGHEDLLQNQGGVISGINSTDTNHGTAVLGEISGDTNGFGVTGIAPDAVISASSFSLPTATAIRAAADRLGPGDVLLLEIHRPGPRATGTGQQGFIAVEWWPDDFLAIRYATGKGVVVVEAAGNGAENLDDPVYDKSPGFPLWWTNPFRRSLLDSGAVVVGAGAPPPGTHGADWGPDRSRLDFSNFGSCLDTQGWGREVTTTGYGDLQAGENPDFWYTDRFSGTSSASPIVVGAVACVQGVLKASDRSPLDGWQVRDLLRNTGWPQQDAPGRPATQRIGNRPDLSQLIPAALA